MLLKVLRWPPLIIKTYPAQKVSSIMAEKPREQRLPGQWLNKHGESPKPYICVQTKLFMLEISVFLKIEF